MVGLDLNASMLAVARSIPRPLDAAIEWHEGSAISLPFSDGGFDVVFCQLGLQFFPDRPGALREMRRVLRSTGRLALNVYTAIERTPVAHALAEALDRHLGAGASDTKRAEHSLADAEALRALVAAQGFDDVTVSTVTQTLHFTSPREYVRLQIEATPMTALVNGLTPPQRDVVVDAITQDVSAALNSHDGTLTSTQEAHFLIAQRS